MGLMVYMQPVKFQSTRLSRASTRKAVATWTYADDFNPQGSREPRLFPPFSLFWLYNISIHKALASLDSRGVVIKSIGYISIHKALASLDSRILIRIHITGYFNPQGSREPRQNYASAADIQMGFQSTRLSRASTLLRRLMYHLLNISIHKALASLDESKGIG